jgi:hypothetical protein
LVAVSCESAAWVGLCAGEYIGVRVSTRNNATILIFESSLVSTKLHVRIATALPLAQASGQSELAYIVQA